MAMPTCRFPSPPEVSSPISSSLASLRVALLLVAIRAFFDRLHLQNCYCSWLLRARSEPMLSSPLLTLLCSCSVHVDGAGRRSHCHEPRYVRIVRVTCLSGIPLSPNALLH